MAEGYEPKPFREAENQVVDASYNVNTEGTLYVSRVGKIVFVSGYYTPSFNSGTDIIKGLPKPVTNAYRFTCQDNAGTKTVVLYFPSTNTDKLKLATTSDGANFSFSYVTSE